MPMFRLLAIVAILSTMLIHAQDRPATEGVRVSGAVMAGQVVSKVAPIYPQDAREQHISGSVVLHALIGRDGHVQNLTVVSGPEILRHSAIDAVEQWVYRPYLLNGNPTPVETTITVNYSFGDDPPQPEPTPLDSRDAYGSTGDRVHVPGGEMQQRLLHKVDLVNPCVKESVGTVELHVLIDKDGSVSQVTPVSGPERRVQSAIEAVRQWTYRPYLVHGEPVNVETTVTMTINCGGS